MKRPTFLAVIAIVLFISAGFLMRPGYLRAADGAVKVSAASVVSKVNINTASNGELEQVRGIGPVLAGRIVQYRNENGKFSKLEDLANVKGIGGANFQKIKEQVAL
ncbi:MAG: ComEA family DNA-binding protein [Candidatus Omnitrophica bacterium]|nr:ComEA family DNA-binding protein [Candidatus Omnitrophota bacterium]